MTPHGVLIGRDVSNDIVLPDPKISRVHAEIAFENGAYVFRDRKSTNGSTINGYPSEKQVLMPGDHIQLGAIHLVAEEQHSTASVAWNETSPHISFTFPVDSNGPPLPPLDHEDTTRIKSTTQSDAPAKPALSELLNEDDLIAISKRLKNLEVLYGIQRDLSNIMAHEDLYKIIERTILENFPEVERLCLLRKDESGIYEVEIVRARGHDSIRSIPVSNSILAQAESQRVGVIASDAAADTRFSNSESMIQNPVRSVMCAPMIYHDEVTGVLYVDNPQKTSCFDAEDLAMLSAIAGHAAIALQNAELYENVQKAYHQAILALINTLETRDPYKIGHTQRTCRYALGIAQELGVGPERLQALKTAAQLHDIGKIGVDENLLGKSDGLSETEILSIQNHVAAAEKILRPIENLRKVMPIILGHHERYDGAGYPEGLKGEEIVLEARILAIADAFDAMTTQRPYNKPMSFRDAIKRCRECAGSQFDPQVVEALATFLESNYESTASRRPGDGKTPAN